MAVNELGYFGFARTKGDASRVDSAARGVPALLVPTGDRDLHFASAADKETDWNVANPTHPTLYVHSETTPATDYLAFSHDATSGIINVASGTMVLQIDGTTVVSVAAAGVTYSQDLILSSGFGVNAGSATQSTISDGDGATNLIPEGQFHGVGTAFAGGAVAVATYNTTNTRAVSPKLALVKGGAATQVATTAVADNEVVGSIIAYGSDGADFETPVGAIEFVVDDVGGPGAGAIGGSLEFSTTADGGETLTLSFTVNSDQNIYVQNNNGVVVGHTGQITFNALVPELQVLGSTVGVDGALAVALYSSSAAEGPEIILARSKSATLGTNTIVATNDSLGRIVFMGADGGTGFDPAAAIVAEVANTPGAATDMPGRLLFQTSPDASQTPATRMTILSGATTVAQAQLGTAGTSTGAMLMAGATSGVLTLTVGAAAGTWTMQLPAAVGSAGQQLTDASGDGVCTWAAASLGEWKNDLGVLDPHEALEAVVGAPTHRFTYNKEAMPLGQWAPPDVMTGIFAEEAPWAMHGERDGYRSGVAFSTINAFGYARAAIQALYEDFQGALAKIAGLESQVAALGGAR